ncbi:MAG: flagellar biosynthetic protein FliR [Gammaproteobacteria bacterium]
MTLTESAIAETFGMYYWPFVRIAAVLMVAPVFSASMVAPRARIMIAVALTIVVAPLLTPPQVAVNPLSLSGALMTIQQLLIGVAMGFALQMVFDALIIAGQAMAMSMGLGFAVAIDPQRGVNVPVVSQYFVMMATLMFLTLNGHLMIIQMVVESFAVLPVGAGGLLRDGAWQIVAWGSDMFQGALRVALPAMVALLIVNLSFGVISRSAPALNLFAIGFPLTLTLGFVIMMVALPGAMQTFTELLNDAFTNAGTILGAGRTP